MKRRKLLPALLLTILLFCLASCSGGDKADAPAGDTDVMRELTTAFTQIDEEETEAENTGIITEEPTDLTEEFSEAVDELTEAADRLTGDASDLSEAYTDGEPTQGDSDPLTEEEYPVGDIDGNDYTGDTIDRGGFGEGAEFREGVEFREGERSEYTYVVNENTRRFHYPDCASADEIAPRNRRDFAGARSELIAEGYVPCKNCNP